MSIFKIDKHEIFVIQQLIHKDKSRENASAFLGQFWQVMDCCVNTLVLVLIFGFMFQNKKFVAYPVYIATGVMIFNLFSFGTKNCLSALSGNKKLLINSQISKELYVKEKVMVAVVNFGYTFLIYILLLIAYKIPFHFSFLLIIPDVILFTLFVYGFGKILAIVNVLFADIYYFHDIFTLFVFYGSALFYIPERLSAKMQFLLSLNPAYIAIAIARQSIMDGIIPHFTLWLKLIIYVLVMLGIGNYIFKKGSDDIIARI